MAARLEYSKKISQAEIDEFTKKVEEIWNDAMPYHSDKEGWKLNKEGPDGVVIYAKKSQKGKTVFKLEGVANLDKDNFFKKFFGMEEAEDIPKWNSTMQLVQVLQEIDPGTHLCYQVTTPTGPGGMVSSRDFVLLRRMKKVDSNKYIVCYSSYEMPELPAVKNIVRAWSYPSIAVIQTPPDGDPNKTLLSWVVDMDLKLSYIPTAIFNQVFQYLLLDNMKSIRERCDNLREGREKM